MPEKDLRRGEHSLLLKRETEEYREQSNHQVVLLSSVPSVGGAVAQELDFTPT